MENVLKHSFLAERTRLSCQQLSLITEVQEFQTPRPSYFNSTSFFC